ncbi:MAG TPA: hypothetical protein VMY18_07000, partial [Acidobacteriota bacterium]|nr:hypothetical protein [Acidobacteriota bacterium]
MKSWKLKSAVLTKVLLVLGSAIFYILPCPVIAAGSLVTDWDVTPLYSSLEAWEKAKAEIPEMVEELNQYKGRLDE